MQVHEVKFMCFIGEHEYSQTMYFYGTTEEANTWAEDYASSYWDTYEEGETYWDAEERAYCADFPFRGVRVEYVIAIEGLACYTSANDFETTQVDFLCEETC